MSPRARPDSKIGLPDPASSDKPTVDQPPSDAPKLQRLRQRIDVVDRRMLKLLAGRGELVRALAALKLAEDLPPRDCARETRLIAALRRCNPGPYSDDELGSIMRAVLSASRALMAREG